jgi:hypothetical protein
MSLLVLSLNDIVKMSNKKIRKSKGDTVTLGEGRVLYTQRTKQSRSYKVIDVFICSFRSKVSSCSCPKLVALSSSDVGYSHLIYRGKTGISLAVRRCRDAGKGTATSLLRFQ